MTPSQQPGPGELIVLVQDCDGEGTPVSLTRILFEHQPSNISNVTERRACRVMTVPMQ